MVLVKMAAGKVEEIFFSTETCRPEIGIRKPVSGPDIPKFTVNISKLVVPPRTRCWVEGLNPATKKEA
jgi:hypothetical protein